MANPMKAKDDFLVKREKKAADATADSAAVFTWFSPVGEPGKGERMRFLVVREDGDLISIQPSPDVKFKVGLDAWRWTEREGGSPVSYLVVKTTGSRVDLTKMKS